MMSIVASNSSLTSPDGKELVALVSQLTNVELVRFVFLFISFQFFV
jgi:hypothetical protein